MHNDAGNLVVVAINSSAFTQTIDGKNQRLNAATTMADFEHALAHFTAHKRSANENWIAEIQLVLKRRGFLAGKVDGAFGPKTRFAIVSFETSIGLPELGLPSQLIYDLLTEKLEIPFKCSSGRLAVPKECREIGLHSN